MADINITDIAAEIQAAVQSGLLDKDTADKALGIMKTTYADLTKPPVARDPKMPSNPPKQKTIAGVACILCGSKTVMDLASDLKPCLTCGTMNTGQAGP